MSIDQRPPVSSDIEAPSNSCSTIDTIVSEVKLWKNLALAPAPLECPRGPGIAATSFRSPVSNHLGWAWHPSCFNPLPRADHSVRRRAFGRRRLGHLLRLIALALAGLSLPVPSAQCADQPESPQA